MVRSPVMSLKFGVESYLQMQRVLLRGQKLLHKYGRFTFLEALDILECL